MPNCCVKDKQTFCVASFSIDRSSLTKLLYHCLRVIYENFFPYAQVYMTKGTQYQLLTLILALKTVIMLVFCWAQLLQ